MASVFKLAFLATTKTALCLQDSFNSPNDVATFAEQKLQSGELSSAEQAFSSSFSKFSNNPSFHYEFISFMLKIGNYESILKLEGATNKRIVNEVKEHQKKIKSRDLKEICSLLSISPMSLEVNLAMAQSLILEKKVNRADSYISFALKLYPNSNDLLYLKAYVLMDSFKYNEALECLKKENSGRLRNLMEFVKMFLQGNLQNGKIQYFVALYREVMMAKMNVNEMINIFDPLYKHVIKRIVTMGCDNGEGVSSFARVLKDLEGTPDNVFYYVKSLIIESQFEEAKNIMEVSMLDEGVKRYLNSFLLLKQNEHKKKLEQEQERRRQQQQRERRRQEQQNEHYGGFQTKNAGKDFLNYYKTLGVTQSVTPDALKKAHRKKIREASKKSVEKLKLPKEKKDEELKNVNKAFQILSDPQKKKSYDLGIDPESAPQGPSHQQQGGQFFQDENIQDIFNSFFNGGQQRSRRGYQRAQFIFL